MIILVIALIVIGPGKLPEVGAALGKSLREFQKASGGITDSLTGITKPTAPPAQAPQATGPVPPAQSYYAAPPAYPAQAAPAPVQAAPAPYPVMGVVEPLPAAPAQPTVQQPPSPPSVG
jgi:TatA/E family protein of Tat protein translocase